MRTNRREFIGRTAAALTLAGRAAAQQQDPWSEVTAILGRIKAPTFPDRDFAVEAFGAAGDGQKDCTEAISHAIDDCNRMGGGRVVVANGVYSTAAIHLKSNVNLYVAKGATLRFLRDPKRYLPLVYTRWEGTECMNYSPFLYADNQENIAITGEGTLDGNCDSQNWWNWVRGAARQRLVDMGARDVPIEERVFGEGSFLRPSFIQPCHSRNVLIEGVTIVNSPMWEVNPVLCTNVIVRGVKINSHGPNNDGCDPDSCRDVLIEDCVFDTGDDCIAIKSGRNRDGRRVNAPTENVIIRNCEMKDGHGGVTIGSEMSGSVRNVFAENCMMSSPHLNEALRFKTNAMRGGTIENVHFRNMEIGEVSDAVLQIDFNYEEGSKGPELPAVRNISLRNVTSKKSKYALNLRGFANAPIRDVRLEDCQFENVAQEDVVENVEGLVKRQVRMTRKGA
ncbi:MAG TPA: glycoside hydrolase family 28 protein [Bryobacteraceae bacterium]|jgi:polygalacturonase